MGASLFLGATVAVLASGAAAQSAPTGQADFEAAAPLKAADLAGQVGGQVWQGTLANGQTWRMDFKSTAGYVFMDVSTGARDTGRWRTEDGRLCIEWQRFPSGCNDWRIAGGKLLLKRTSGEVVAFEKR